MSTVIKGKVVLVGDASVGKTAIVNCFNKLSIDVQPTVGANSISCKVKLAETGEEVTLNVWDTAGQDDFKCLVPMYARCAEVALVVFDQSVPSSYESTGQWIDFMKEQVTVPNVFLIANKNDLEEKVDINRVIEEANEKQVEFFRTSALTEYGIEDLFQKIAEAVSKPTPVQSPEVEPAFQPPKPIDEASTKKKACC